MAYMQAVAFRDEWASAGRGAMCVCLLAAVASGAATDADDEPWLSRYGIWLVQVGVGYLVLQLLPRLRALPQGLLGYTAHALIAATLFTPIALLLEPASPTAEASPAALAGALAGEWLGVTPMFVAGALVIWLARATRTNRTTAAAPNTLASNAGPTRLDPLPSAAAPPPSGSLHAKLPSALGEDLRHLQSDRNHLHVRSVSGTTSLIHSLEAATEELGERGLRVHRSHWIAHDAITRVTRTRNGLRIVLDNGDAIPVSRRRQAAVLARYGKDFRRG